MNSKEHKANNTVTGLGDEAGIDSFGKIHYYKWVIFASARKWIWMRMIIKRKIQGFNVTSGFYFYQTERRAPILHDHFENLANICQFCRFEVLSKHSAFFLVLCPIYTLCPRHGWLYRSFHSQSSRH